MGVTLRSFVRCLRRRHFNSPLGAVLPRTDNIRGGGAVIAPHIWLRASKHNSCLAAFFFFAELRQQL